MHLFFHVRVETHNSSSDIFHHLRSSIMAKNILIARKCSYALLIITLSFSMFIGAITKAEMAPTTVRWDALSESDLDPVVFNWKFYLDANPYLRSTGIKTAAEAQIHWQKKGQNECLRASADFFVRDYMNLNTDIANTISTSNCFAALQHYLKYGRLQGRNKVQPFIYGWQYGDWGTADFGNTVVGNEKISIRTSSRYSGSVSEIWFRGKQYVNNHDTGRLFQTALTFDNRGECFNPTEGGVHSDIRFIGGVLSGKSQSLLNGITLTAGTLMTNISPAYWYTPGVSPQPYCGVAQGVSAVAPDTLTKTISMNYLGDSQMVLWKAEVDTAVDHSAMSLEALTGYHNGEFTEYYNYDLQKKILLRSIPARFGVSPTGTPSIIGNPNHMSPTVISTADGHHSLGIVTLDQEQNTPDELTRIANYAQITALNPRDADDSTTKWSVTFSYINPKKGKYTTNIILIFGNLTEVTEKLNLLYNKIPNQLVKLIGSQLGSTVFDFSYYLAKNPDVKAAFNSDYELTLQHYFTFGVFEGRSGTANFNAKNYLDQNPELQKTLGSADYLGALKYFMVHKSDRKPVPK